jgi:hypothetical protein
MDTDNKYIAKLFESIGGPLLEYKDQHTPRRHIGNKVYTSTEYPNTQIVPFHSENSKNRNWPMNIFFFA